MRWFQRPYRVRYKLGNIEWINDGWWFMAFGTPFRVRGWRIYRWEV